MSGDDPNHDLDVALWVFALFAVLLLLWTAYVADW